MSAGGNAGTNAYAAILAGGSGARMGNPEKPKQFFMLGEKPILIHTVEKFCAFPDFQKVLVMCPQVWLQQTQDLIRRHCPQYEDRIALVAGGAERNDTVMNAIAYVEQNCPADNDTILVTHDAVRPFVSHRIIRDNIAAAREHGACDTVVPATDTIVESMDGRAISAIPNRSVLYQGQTPQSFNLHKLKELTSSLTDEERATLTDACKIFVLRGERVVLVEGDVANMKITYPQDMRVATSLMGK